MASLAQTVTNTMVVLGQSPVNTWGNMTWGTDNWGNDGDLCTEVNKVIANTTTLTDQYFKSFEISFTNTLDFSEDLSSVLRELGIYDYLASRPTTNWVSQVVDASTQVTDPVTTFASVADPSTTWTVVT